MIALVRALIAEPDLWPTTFEIYQGAILSIDRRRKDAFDTLQGINQGADPARKASEEVLYFRHADAKMMRLVKLDAPTVMVKKMTCKSVTLNIKTQVREHRFAQLLNGGLHLLQGPGGQPGPEQEHWQAGSAGRAPVRP